MSVRKRIERDGEGYNANLTRNANNDVRGSTSKRERDQTSRNSGVKSNGALRVGFEQMKRKFTSVME